MTNDQFSKKKRVIKLISEDIEQDSTIFENYQLTEDI